MNGQSIYNRYTPAFQPHANGEKPELLFIFNKDNLLVNIGNGDQKFILPGRDMRDHEAFSSVFWHYLGDFDQHDCYCAASGNFEDLPAGFEFCSLRILADQFGEDVFLLAGRAHQILHWDSQSRFCGRCGSPTRMKDNERAKQCDNCGNIVYPRISPAIIVAIIRDDKILLAHNKNFRQNMYSLIAGFMEPGEEFEDTIQREVFEEVGIKVKNIRYYASQPWPFPDSLMIGFVCDYAGGEIIADGHEIVHADWFDRDSMPEIPAPARIAGKIIKEFIDYKL
jgi:NAD+ diphosphatase